MGLKTSNYEIKELGITLPNAYAIIHELRVCGNNGLAIFHVQSSPRANALELKPLKTVTVKFNWTRDTNPLVVAYSKAKEMGYKKEWDSETRAYVDVESPQPFYGWEDDIETVETEEATPAGE